MKIYCSCYSITEKLFSGAYWLQHLQNCESERAERLGMYPGLC